MADKSAEKERLFNEWFTASYDRLRGTLRRYGMLDEDNFHDTYLFVRRQVLVPGKDITDYDAYFIGCYICNLQIFLCLFLEKLNMPQNTPVTKAS